MNIDEIRKNRPEGATHYDEDNDYYKLVGGGKFLIWNDEDDMGFWDYLYCDISDLELKPL